MKKIFLTLVLSIFIISLVSADFGDIKTFDKDYGLYGKIEINDYLGLSNKVDYVLTSYDSSVIKSWAEGEYKSYQNTDLFDGVFYKDIYDNIGEFEDANFFILVNETYEVEERVWVENCKVRDELTGECTYDTTENKTVQKNKIYWKKYNYGEVVPKGEGKWRLEANKPINKKVDFIIEAQGKEFVEWAWWNNSWLKKKLVNVTEQSGGNLSNYSVRLNVTFDSDMNTDFSDLRFTDDTETNELNYWVEEIRHSNYAIVWVYVDLLEASKTEQIYMYYGNSGASSNSDIFNSFRYGNDGTVDDVVDNFIGTCSATSSSGILNFTVGSSGACKINLYDSYTTNKWELNFEQRVFPGGVAGLGLGDDGASDWRDESTHNHEVVGDNDISSWEGAAQQTWGWTNFSWKNFTVQIDMAILTLSDGVDMEVKLQNGTIFNRNGAGARDAGNFNNLDHLRLLSGVGTTVEVDNIRFRLKASSEPTIVFLAEESNFVAPTVTLNSPANNSNLTNNVVSFNCNATDSLNIENVSLFLDGVINETNSSGYNGTYIFTKTLSQGDHNWNCQAYNNNSLSSNGTQRSLSIDNINPVITILSPNGTYGSLIAGDPIDLNYTVVDANIDSCWYDYNGTNYSLPSCNNGSIAYELGNNNITLYANDTFGNVGYKFNSWSVNLIINSQSYNDPVLEGSSQNFIANITLGQQPSSVYLWYNGTKYTGTFSLSGSFYILSRTITIPSVDSDVQKNFFWGLTLADSTQINFSSLTQNVTDVSIDDCSSNNITIINYTMYDEDSQNFLNGTSENTEIQVWLELFPPSDYSTPVISFNKTFNKTNPAAICLFPNLNYTWYYLDSKAQYSSDNRRIEYHNIRKYNLSNSSLNQNISLYDLNSTKSTRFLINVKGENFLPLENAVVDISREYVGENLFKTVEIPITDSNGQAVASLRKDDTVYTIRISRDGVLLSSFSNIVAVCENELTEECTLNLNIFGSNENIQDFDSYYNVNYGSSWDESSRNIQTTFTTLDGSSSTLNVTAVLYNRFENTTICSDELTSSSGTLNCNVPISYDNSTVLIRTYKDGDLVGTSKLSLSQDTENFFGNLRYVFLAILIFMIPLMFFTSLIGMVVGAIIGLLVAGMLLLTTGGTSLSVSLSIIWLIIAGGIIIWRLSKGGVDE